MKKHKTVDMYLVMTGGGARRDIAEHIIRNMDFCVMYYNSDEGWASQVIFATQYYIDIA
ncbi:hypothetical protein ACFLTQ_01345 [Chloroflexota bacterium]